MPSSIYLAKLLGPVLLAVGLSMLLNPDGYMATVGSMLGDPSLLYVAAVLGLIGGVALVLAHNVWRADWRIIITLIGWISIIDSLTWILLTRTMQQFWSPLLQSSVVALVGGIVVLLLGAALCYFGYRTSKSIGRQ